jgi:multiple antibiotic resistance protein
MSPLLIKISKDFATLWTTIDPIGNVALFAGLTASLTRVERHRTALKAVFYATIILVVAGTVGQIILDAIGIHMHSLKVAGGIIETRSLPALTRSYPRRFTFYVAEPLSSILFLFGVQMLFGKMDAKTERSPEEGRDLAVFQLAVPSIAGPGAMMAVIVLTDNDVYTVPQRIETGVVLLVVLFLTYSYCFFRMRFCG